jgi:hypothetical protein
MDLSNSSLWRLVYVNNFTSEYIRALSIPIGEFETDPISRRITRIRVTNSRAGDNWTYAGHCRQIINAGGVSSSVKKQSLDLNIDNVIIWEDFSSYKLRIKFPRYFTQATITIYEYIGVIPSVIPSISVGF